MEIQVVSTGAAGVRALPFRRSVDVGNVFRSVNERIYAINDAFDRAGPDGMRHEYVCECADAGCVRKLELTRAEYRAVRAHASRFLVWSGHAGFGDRVVQETPAFVVIEREPRKPPVFGDSPVATLGLDVELTELGDARYVLALTGEVDLHSAPAFERELLAAIGNGARDVAIDLTGATFIDSTFLGVLLSGRKRLGLWGGRISIVCADRNLLKLFEITGLEQLFTIVPTLDGWLRPV